MRAQEKGGKVGKEKERNTAVAVTIT